MAAEGQLGERRSDQRFPVRLRCWIQRESITLLGTTLNISRGGVFIRTSPGLEPGTIVHLEIGAEGESFAARGRVVWNSDRQARRGNPPGIGVLLTEILSATQRFERLVGDGAPDR